MNGEYIHQFGAHSFLWLLIDPDTEQPIEGGTTSTREKAEKAIAKAKDRNTHKEEPPPRKKKTPTPHRQRVVSRTNHIRGKARA